MSRLAGDRTERNRDLQAELDAMRDQIIDARVATGRVLKGAKVALGDLTVSLAPLSAVSGDLMKKVTKVLAEAPLVLGTPGPEEISVAEAMRFMKQLIRMMKDLAWITATLCDVERAELGDPLKLPNVEPKRSHAEIVEEIRRAKEMYANLDLDDLEPMPE